MNVRCIVSAMIPMQAAVATAVLARLRLIFIFIFRVLTGLLHVRIHHGFQGRRGFWKQCVTVPRT